MIIKLRKTAIKQKTTKKTKKIQNQKKKKKNNNEKTAKQNNNIIQFNLSILNEFLFTRIFINICKTRIEKQQQNKNKTRNKKKNTSWIAKRFNQSAQLKISDVRFAGYIL